MTRLRSYAEDHAGTVRFESMEFAAIQAHLAGVGVRFERWHAGADIQPGDPQDRVIAAYRADIDRLMAEGGYQAVDVVSLHPTHPDKAALRRKFLDEHTHGEDEVRFFVAGRGLFTLHIGDEVHEVLCERGDLIAIPAGTPHWFDMGPEPSFVAIRIFTNPAGWVAHFTGDAIAERFPRLAV
ncbi:MAG: cupin domain-containing protein [Xanthomonadales bacterium]|nr:cupin domain-containing protein [Xanthomonadales bacterium]MCE7929943.1 cupin domain-containing protein [Xanthomonadales bacterium PRO6]